MEEIRVKTTDIICIGMALVDSIIKGFDPEPVSASGFTAVSGTLNVGGEAVNEASAAAKLGMKTAILCTLGRDTAGDMITDSLKKDGVDTGLIIRDPEHATPVTTMFVNDDGTRKSITNRAHRHNFHPENHKEAIKKARAIILGSIFRAPFDDPDIIMDVLSYAKKNDVLTFADTKLPNFRKLTLNDIKNSMPYMDFITPNEDEAKFFSGKTDPEQMAEVFLSYGVKNVIIKLGEHGCLFKNENTMIRLPAMDIEAVDATGAGDNFVAGFATAILKGKGTDEALKFANACGAVCTTAIGAGTALKSYDQVDDFLKEQYKGR